VKDIPFTVIPIHPYRSDRMNNKPGRQIECRCYSGLTRSDIANPFPFSKQQLLTGCAINSAVCSVSDDRIWIGRIYNHIRLNCCDVASDNLEWQSLHPLRISGSFPDHSTQ